VRLATLTDDTYRRLRSKVRWQQRLKSWEAARFDRKLGVDTAGRLFPADLTIPEGDADLGVVYEGTSMRAARWWLPALPADRARFTFIDLGSGKGRALLLAKQAGFGRVIGVEFAEELHRVAAGNAEAAAKHGLPIETYLGDAGSFEFPDGPLVVHFFNPFHDPVMRRVIENLTDSYTRDPRPVVVLYHQMTVEEPQDATGNIALLDDVPFLTGRTLEPAKGLLDRKLLGWFTVRIYESAELSR
jgi:SAM-dependent methyltransferase